MKDRLSIQGGRRTFFRSLLGLAVAAGGGAWFARRGSATPSAKASVAPADMTAYRETEHIRKYYRSARG